MTDTISTRDEARAARINRINAMIAKANGGTTSEEAEALLAKVAEMMLKYSIDDEELRQGGDATAEAIEIWSVHIDERGGHGPHRLIALTAVATAMGASCFFTKSKHRAYKDRITTLYVVAPAGVLAAIKQFLPLVSLKMETMAEAASRTASRKAREVGAHHSNVGCHARRGFMQGFGAGIADRITRSQEALLAQARGTGTELVIVNRASALEAYMAENFGPMKTKVSRLKIDHGAFQSGVKAGSAFASPTVSTADPSKGISAS